MSDYKFQEVMVPEISWNNNETLVARRTIKGGSKYLSGYPPLTTEPALK